MRRRLSWLGDFLAQIVVWLVLAWLTINLFLPWMLAERY